MIVRLNVSVLITLERVLHLILHLLYTPIVNTQVRDTGIFPVLVSLVVLYPHIRRRQDGIAAFVPWNLSHDRDVGIVIVRPRLHERP